MKFLFLLLAILFISVEVYSFKSSRVAVIKAGCITRLLAQKFDPETFISISLSKPFGLSLEEIEENGKKGVFIGEISEGSAKVSGKIYAGLFLVSANGQDLKYEDFDTILDALRNSPDDKPVDLVFVDQRSVYRGPAVLTVSTPEGGIVSINCLKGQPMRDVLMGAGINVYGSRAKLTNCGGVGQCSTCAVLIEDTEDWEPRSEVEGLRLKKYADNARLSCTTIIEGDCTVIILPSKLGIRNLDDSITV